MRILSITINSIILLYIRIITITNPVLTVDICELQVRIANYRLNTYMLTACRKKKRKEKKRKRNSQF